jgi:hypothetical protein
MRQRVNGFGPYAGISVCQDTRDVREEMRALEPAQRENSAPHENGRRIVQRAEDRGRLVPGGRSTVLPDEQRPRRRPRAHLHLPARPVSRHRYQRASRHEPRGRQA